LVFVDGDGVILAAFDRVAVRSVGVEDDGRRECDAMWIGHGTAVAFVIVDIIGSTVVARRIIPVIGGRDLQCERMHGVE
jgi:hypothetical protein